MGHEVVVASRGAQVEVDLVTGAGLREAIEGADTVVSLASNPSSPETVDVQGTRRVIEAIAGQHLVYLSIVGVDRHPLPYYRAKLEAERIISSSGVAHTVIRATQFHDFVEWRLAGWCHRRIALVPAGYVYQPVAKEEVAAELARISVSSPTGTAPDFAGPEVLTIDALARGYMTARGRETPLARYPKPGAVAAGYRSGLHTNPSRAVGITTWADYLDERFGERPSRSE
jgi:uncharacterized protein YbjT (DUF2867 family)